MKNLTNKALIFFFILLTGPLFGQASFDEDVTDVPVDGGIITVTLMAAAYGAKKYRENNKD